MNGLLSTGKWKQMSFEIKILLESHNCKRQAEYVQLIQHAVGLLAKKELAKWNIWPCFHPSVRAQSVPLASRLLSEDIWDTTNCTYQECNSINWRWRMALKSADRVEQMGLTFVPVLLLALKHMFFREQLTWLPEIHTKAPMYHDLGNGLMNAA